MLATGTVADAIGVGIPALVSDWPYLAETLGDAGIRVGHTARRDRRRALDALTRERPRRRPGPRCTRSGPTYDWAPLAARTADLFERVVLDEP